MTVTLAVSTLKKSHCCGNSVRLKKGIGTMVHLIVNNKIHSADLLEDVVQHNKADWGDCATLTLGDHFCLPMSRAIAGHCLTLTFSTTRRTVESPKCPFMRGPPVLAHWCALMLSAVRLLASGQLLSGQWPAPLFVVPVCCCNAVWTSCQQGWWSFAKRPFFGFGSCIGLGVLEANFVRFLWWQFNQFPVFKTCEERFIKKGQLQCNLLQNGDSCFQRMQRSMFVLLFDMLLQLMNFFKQWTDVTTTKLLCSGVTNGHVQTQKTWNNVQDQTWQLNRMNEKSGHCDCEETFGPLWRQLIFVVDATQFEPKTMPQCASWINFIASETGQCVCTLFKNDFRNDHNVLTANC